MLSVNQIRKKGINDMKAGTYTYGSMGNQEVQQLAGLFGNYQQGLGNAISMMGPGGLQAQIDQFRNRALQNATQAGMQGAALARWGGLGSGGQEAAMTRAMALGQNQADQFGMEMYSPEGIMRRQQALGGLFQPNMLQTAWNMRQAHRATAPPPSQGGGFLGGLLQTAGQMVPFVNWGNRPKMSQETANGIAKGFRFI